MLALIYLADRPELLETVSRWVHGEWGHLMPERSLEDVTRFFGGQLQRDAIPLTLVALCDGEPVGTASIYLHDVPTRPELTPWLAAVFVAPKYRRQGIGSALVGAIEDAARRLQVARLYLITPDQQHFYQRLGWSAREEIDYRGERVTIMTRELSES